MKTTFTILFFALGISLLSNAATKNIFEIRTTFLEEKSNLTSAIQHAESLDEVNTALSESQQYPKRPRRPKRPFKGNEFYYIGGVIASAILVVGVPVLYVLTNGEGLNSR